MNLEAVRTKFCEKQTFPTTSYAHANVCFSENLRAHLMDDPLGILINLRRVVFCCSEFTLQDQTYLFYLNGLKKNRCFIYLMHISLF